MFWERLKTVFGGWLVVKPKQPIDSHIQPIVCFQTITENCFVLWLSFKWFYKWMCFCFKCFDQSLKAINSLLSFVTKNNWDLIIEKHIWVFHWFCFSRVERLLWYCFDQRESGIGFSSCIDFKSFCNKCNPSILYVNSGVIGQEVLCALEVVKINILGGVCAEPKEVCVLRGSRSLLWWCV